MPGASTAIWLGVLSPAIRAWAAPVPAQLSMALILAIAVPHGLTMW